MADLTNFIKEVPKTDIHLHLDGSLRISTLLDLAKKYKVELPGKTEEELKLNLFKENYASLDEYLKGFLYIGQVLNNPEDFERIAYELGIDCYSSGVVYIEAIVAPHLHLNEHMTDKDVVTAVDNGLQRAKAEINSKLSGDMVPFEYGIILATMRFFNEYFSYYFKRFVSCFPNTPKEHIYPIAAMELAHLAVNLKNEGKIQLSGYDIVGCELGFPVEWFKDVFSYLRKNLIRIRIHAGEADGPMSMFNALGLCYAERLGHGLHLFEKSKYNMKDMKDVDKFLYKLKEYIAQTQTNIEVNLTSNSQTAPEYRDLTNHPLRRMLDEGISVSMSTDNMLVSSTNMVKEFLAAVKYCKVTKSEIYKICLEGVRKSFFPKSYKDKMEYLKKVEKRMEQLKKIYGE